MDMNQSAFGKKTFESIKYWDPRLEVIMKTTLVKSMVFP